MSLDFPGINGPNNVINSHVVVATGNKLSAAIWFKPAANDGGGTNRRLWSQGDKNVERACLFFMGGNKLAYVRHATGGGTQRWELTTGLEKITDWRCVVVTHDPIKPAGADAKQPDPIMYIYRPGDALVINKVGTGLTKTTTNSNPPIADNKRFRVGNSEPTRDLPFKGKIASFVVWRVVLTEAQVKSFIYRGDKSVIGNDVIEFGWDMRLPQPVPVGPTLPPTVVPGTIMDWTASEDAGGPWGPSGVRGLTKVVYINDNPPRRMRTGPYIMAE